MGPSTTSRRSGDKEKAENKRSANSGIHMMDLGSYFKHRNPSFA